MASYSASSTGAGNGLVVECPINVVSVYKPDATYLNAFSDTNAAQRFLSVARPQYGFAYDYDNSEGRDPVAYATYLLGLAEASYLKANDEGARDAYNAVFGLAVTSYGWAYDSTLGRAALDALKDDALAFVADQGGIRVESRTPVSGGQFTVTLSKAGGVLVAFQPLSGGQLTFVTSETSATSHTITLPLLKAGSYRVIPVAFETPLTEGA